MLFTIDEARILKPKLAQIKEFKGEFGQYKALINAFSVWLFLLTTTRSLITATAVVALFRQDQNLITAWNDSSGIVFFLFYLLLSCIPLIGKFVTIGTPIVVLASAFVVGNGIAGNFVPFLLPIILAYVLTFGIIALSNYSVNSIIKSSCPKIYKEIKFLSEADEFTRMFYDAHTQVRNATYDVKENKSVSQEKPKSNTEQKVDEEEF